MAKAEIQAGVCGFTTQAKAEQGENHQVHLQITSGCPDIQELADDLQEVNAFQEISFRKGVPSILQKSHLHCSHASCPVPAGIIKAVEVAAGLALPRDVTIVLSGESD